MNKLGIACILLATLSGCASKETVPIQESMRSSDISALNEFERLSIEMVHEMRLWAKAKESVSREVLSEEQVRQRFFQSTHVPKGFNKLVTFKFYGPAVKAAEAIAMSAGYEFSVKNKAERRGDHIVDIDISNDRLVEALYEIGLATGSSVMVEVIEDEGEGKGKLIYRYVE